MVSRGFHIPDGRDIDARRGKTSTKDRIATRNADQCDHQCNKSIQCNDHSNVRYTRTTTIQQKTAATAHFVRKHRDDCYLCVQNEVKYFLSQIIFCLIGWCGFFSVTLEIFLAIKSLYAECIVRCFISRGRNMLLCNRSTKY